MKQRQKSKLQLVETVNQMIALGKSIPRKSPYYSFPFFSLLVEASKRMGSTWRSRFTPEAAFVTLISPEEVQEEIFEQIEPDKKIRLRLVDEILVRHGFEKAQSQPSTTAHNSHESISKLEEVVRKSVSTHIVCVEGEETHFALSALFEGKKIYGEGASLMEATSHAVGESKRCTQCKKLLPLSHFVRRSASADGLEFACKQCRSQKAKVPRERSAPES